MLKTKYDVLTRNGKEQFVVIPVEDYKGMLERLEDDADFRVIEASKKRQAGAPRMSLAEVKRMLRRKALPRGSRR